MGWNTFDFLTAYDPEQEAASFTVERAIHTRTRSGDGTRSRTARAAGSVQPGTPEMARLLPEKERRTPFIAVYTDYPLSAGDCDDGCAEWTAPDRIRWNGRTWRVVRVRDWQAFGYYQAYAVLEQEKAGSRPAFTRPA